MKPADHLGLVYKIAGSFRIKRQFTLTYMDLVNAGYFGLDSACKTWDGVRSFNVYAGRCIKNAIIEYIRKELMYLGRRRLYVLENWQCDNFAKLEVDNIFSLSIGPKGRCLSQKYKKALLLWMTGYKEDEIGREFNVSGRTANTYVNYGIRQLRSAIREQ